MRPLNHAPTVEVTVNGEPRTLEPGTGLEELVAALVPRYVADGTPQGVAVALDDAVVPRGSWATTAVVPGARIEIVAAVQGG